MPLNLGGFGKLVKTSFRKVKLTDAAEPTQFIGRKLMCSKELGGPLEEVTIEDIKGCAAIGVQGPEYDKMVKSFQINGDYFCDIYSFFIQMHEGRLPTPEETEEFHLATQITRVKEIK